MTEQNIDNQERKINPVNIHLNYDEEDVTIEINGDIKSLPKLFYFSIVKSSELKEAIMKALERYNEAEEHLHRMIERKLNCK